MLQCFDATVADLLTMVRKGDGRTLREDQCLEYDLALLPECDRFVDPGGHERDMTPQQLHFVRHVLPAAVSSDAPKIDDMMRVFGLSVTTRLLYEQSESDYDACTRSWFGH